MSTLMRFFWKIPGVLACLILVGISTSAAADNDQVVQFSDVNFKLAVISELMEAGAVDLGDFPSFLQRIEGPDYDYENDGYQLSRRAYQYFRDVELTQSQLAKIDRLTFDGGLKIYRRFPASVFQENRKLADVMPLEPLSDTHIEGLCRWHRTVTHTGE